MTLAFDAVSHRYGDALAVDSVSLEIGEGQLVALTGPNGSGKSTLLRLASRVLNPHAGTIRYRQRLLAEWGRRDYAREVGYLPQDPDPAFPMRAIDVVVTGRAPYVRRFSWESEDDWSAAERALALCDATHLAGRYLDEMSGGEKKRVFLARVLAGNARLILLDEPLAALDLAHVQQVSSLLREVVDKTGASVVFASHELNWAAAYSDRVVVMQQGRIALDATPAEVMQPDVMRACFGIEVEAVSAGGRAWVVPKTEVRSKK